MNAQKFDITKYFADVVTVESKHDDHRFDEIVTQVRMILHQTQGKTEEERQEYSKELNLAVLGYERERAKFRTLIETIITKENFRASLPASSKYNNLADAVFSEIIGLKLLEPYYHDPQIEEIKVYGKDIAIVMNGEEYAVEERFASYKDVENLQQNLVLHVDDRLDRNKPRASVTMVDHSRVTMMIPPYFSEPQIRIRLFRNKIYSFSHLLEKKTINEKMMDILLALVLGKATTVIIGDTNSGKTTTIKSVIYEIDKNSKTRNGRKVVDSIVTFESELEMYIKELFPNMHVAEAQTVPEIGLDGTEAFRDILRMTPKRVFVQEVRDKDANDFVRAATRGHRGSWSGMHITEVEGVAGALADMMMQDGRNINYEVLVKRIAKEVIDVVIQQREVELSNGERYRKITRITEIDYKDGEVVINDLVRYDPIREEWIFPNQMSTKLSQLIFYHHRESFYNLVNIGVVDETCLSS